MSTPATRPCCRSPASLEPTTVSIMSRVNTLFNWVETNAVGDEWYAHVSAAVRLWVTYDGEFRQASSAQFVNLLASPKQLRTHQRHCITCAERGPHRCKSPPQPAAARRSAYTNPSNSLPPRRTAIPTLTAYFPAEPLAVQLREG